MIVLNEKNIFLENRQSSKGNQLKGRLDGSWYKADYLGYEGLAEYMVSGLLKKTSLGNDEFIDYKTEKIQYKNTEFTGCVSANFLKKGWQLISLERLFQSYYGESLNRSLYRLPEADRLLNEEAGYPQDIKERVSTILRWQKHRYQYLFQK